MKPIILGSASPRRKELFSRITPQFEVFPADCDETVPEGMKPNEVVRLLACRKAQAVAERFPQAAVVGADTIVVLDGRILGKPDGREEAARMLRALSGRRHQVLTGVSVVFEGKQQSFVEQTQVEFYELSNEEIEGYLCTGEPMDKAGAYGIQGFGALLVREISGDYYNVVGLPLAHTARLLQKMGVTAALMTVTHNS
ncbi:MAG: septum formation inhibitor Maf [Clostridiales bacterium]|nr:septum formation inhibitor Maf [Clostridiales bacterium]